jgi:Domain of unknown function (DUF4884)
MKYLLSALLVLSVLGCGHRAQEPLGQVQTSNPTYDVELLFEKDGCKIYRFHDSGYDRYFTTCEGSITSENTEPEGKQKKQVQDSNTTSKIHFHLCDANTGCATLKNF